MNAPAAQLPGPMKSTGIAYLLWFFLGGAGAHKFYLRRPGLGCLYICLLLLFWMGVFTLGGDAVSLAMGQRPSGRSAITSIVMMAPLSLALLYDLFTIPLQVRAANGGIVSKASGYFGFGSKSAQAFDDNAGLDGERLAKVDQAIARYKAQQATPAPAAARAAVASRAPVAASGTPTFGKRR
jgi:TM2 domain-containing membrane protein YozV